VEALEMHASLQPFPDILHLFIKITLDFLTHGLCHYARFSQIWSHMIFIWWNVLYTGGQNLTSVHQQATPSIDSAGMSTE